MRTGPGCKAAVGGGDCRSFREQAASARIGTRVKFRQATAPIVIYSWKPMSDFRLGDVIDDYCVKCRRLTNHSIVSLVNALAAKVRCRTCYSDHDYRNETAPPTKK